MMTFIFGFIAGFAVGGFLAMGYFTLKTDQLIQERLDRMEDEGKRRIIRQFFGFPR